MKFLRPWLTPTLLVAASLVAVNARAAVGDIFETNEQSILRFKPTGGTPGTFAAGLSNPKGLVFDGKGRLFVTDASRGLIQVYNTIDGLGATYASGLGSPVGLAFDTAGNLYVADSASGTIFKFAEDGTKTSFATGTGGPGGLAFDNSGNLLVADFTGGKVYKVTPAGTVSTFVTGLNLPAGLAVNTAGDLFVADSGSGAILKFTPAGTKSSFATGLGRPFGIAFEAAGSLVVADNETGETLRFGADGVKKVIFGSDFNTPQFVAIEPAIHQLLNISTRGVVQTGDNVLFAGFIVGGNGPVGTTIVVRALGPSLSTAGVPNPLQDPVVELRDSSGNLIASNNDWKDTQEAFITSRGLALPDPRESGIFTSLHGGAYTAIVRGANNTTGTAVLEVYNLQ
jgi:sugar lactone lactonase YvrE